MDAAGKSIHMFARPAPESGAEVPVLTINQMQSFWTMLNLVSARGGAGGPGRTALPVEGCGLSID
jgi:hypothetical protein